MTWIFKMLGGWQLRLAAAGAVVLAALAALFKAYSAGRQSAARDADRANLKAIRKAKEIEDEVDSLGHADVDERLARWLRDR